jgi:hypothetical protein
MPKVEGWRAPLEWNWNPFCVSFTGVLAEVAPIRSTEVSDICLRLAIVRSNDGHSRSVCVPAQRRPYKRFFQAFERFSSVSGVFRSWPN